MDELTVINQEVIARDLLLLMPEVRYRQRTAANRSQDDQPEEEEEESTRGEKRRIRKILIILAKIAPSPFPSPPHSLLLSMPSA